VPAGLDAVTLDEDRQRRCGFPEVIYGEGKSAATLQAIVARMVGQRLPVLVTRLDAAGAAVLSEAFPTGRHNPVARTWRIDSSAGDHGQPLAVEIAGCGHVAIITAGTSDLPVAEEARETLHWMGVCVTMVHDVGVAGPHRFPAHLDRLEGVDAVVVVAGMEGALPSVVGGYVPCPVIAVPTSVGYGASLGGIAALLGMLNSCAANVAVVNIDAGFKGGYLAGMIARRAHGVPGSGRALSSAGSTGAGGVRHEPASLDGGGRCGP